MPSTEIFRTSTDDSQRILGRQFAGFIQNGTFFQSQIGVYEDGVFEAWGGLDVDFLKQKIESGWIASTIQANARVSMHDVGSFNAVDPKCQFDNESLYSELYGYLESLNPKLENLVDFEGSDVEVREGVRYAKLGLIREFPYRQVENDLVYGKSRGALIACEDRWYHGSIIIFQDGVVDVDPRKDVSRLITRDELVAEVEEGRIAFQVEEGAVVHFDGFGSAAVKEGRWYISPSEFIKEVDDDLVTLNGGTGANEKCRAIFDQYKVDPNEESLEQLRQAYYAVPKHHRMYLGDMDSKDFEFRQLLNID